MNNLGNSAAKKTQNRNTSTNVNKKTGRSKKNRGNNNSSSKSKKQKKSKKSNKKTSNNSNSKILSGNQKANLTKVMNTFQDDWVKINQTFEQLNELLKQMAE